MDRLPNLLTTKELLRAVAILAVSILAAYLLAPIIVGMQWRGFTLAVLGTAMPLAWTAFLFKKNLKRESAIRAAQLKEIGELESTDRLPFGVLGVRADGIGVTYFPMTEFFVQWEEIKSATYCQFGQVRGHVTNHPGTDQPRIRSWSKPVIIVQTTRTDFPKFPIIFDTASSADRWIDILERQSPPETVFHLNRLPWKKRFTIFELTVSLVGLLACGVSIAMDHLPGVKGSYDRVFPIFFRLSDAGCRCIDDLRRPRNWFVGDFANVPSGYRRRDGSRKTTALPSRGGTLDYRGVQLSRAYSNRSHQIDQGQTEEVRLGERHFQASQTEPRGTHPPSHPKPRRHPNLPTQLLGAQASLAALLVERPDLTILDSTNLIPQPT